MSATVYRTHVVEGGAGVAAGDDLEGGGLAVAGRGVAAGHGERREAERAPAGDVEEPRGERDVEVGRHVAAPQPQVHEQVRPRVVQLHLERAARHRPVRAVAAGRGGRAGAFFFIGFKGGGVSGVVCAGGWVGAD